MMLFFKYLMVITTGGTVGRNSFRALLAASVLLACASAASAAGLGRLAVLSDLGQPLRAEIDVVAVEKGELDSLNARLGSVEAYLQNNLPYPPPSLGLKLSLEKRASGQPYIKATTAQPVNEPFVDVLVELTWNGGRILRAYTALLDPPAYAEESLAPAAPQAAAPEVRPAPEAAAEPQVETRLGSELLQKEAMPAPGAETAAGTEPVAGAEPAAGAELAPGAQPAAGAEPAASTEPMPGTEPIPGDAVAAAPAPADQAAEQAAPQPAEQTAQPPGEQAAEQPPAEAGMPRTPEPLAPAVEEEYTVKRGDTLTKIAREYKSEDVSLEQMLVVLFRNNREAFSASNMNRMKAGKVLQIPGADEAAGVDLKEARRDVRLQAADFHAYRERIAAAAGMGEATIEQAGQSAAGGVTTGTVEDQGAPAQPKEVLKLSKGDAAGAAAAQERIRSLEEEVAAREKTIQEQADRVARLEKTVKDMQALLDIKSKGMADLQQQAGKAAPAPTTPAPATPATPAPAAAATPAPAATTSQPAAPPPPPATVAAATTPPAAPMPDAQPSAEPMAQSAPAAPTTAAQPGVAAASTPKPRVRAIPPPPQSSLIDDLMGNPLYLAGGAAALGLLGFLGVRTVRRRREAAYDDSVLAEKKNSEIAPPIARSDTAGAMASAMAAATRTAAPAAQVTEEVDPLAEAEIYLAYGRDGQAEEILKEALHTNRRRYEIHLKLLEIYAKRKDAAAFDAIARDLQAGTGGQGEIWLQAVRLGYPLDPQNPRYAAGKPAGGEAAVATAAVAAVAAPSLEERLDFNIGLEDTDTGTKTDIDLTRLGGAAGGTTTDIDLSNLGAPGMSDVDLFTLSGMPEKTLQMPDVDLDLGAGSAEEKSGGLDFDFDLSGLSAPAAQPQRPSPETTQILDRSLMQTVADVGEPGMGTVEFDLSKISLDTGGLGKTEPTLDVTGSVPAIPEIDLSGISLDLGGETTNTGGATSTSAGKDDHWYDVQTKFDLAKAYQEMGDKEGAREILQEVIAEGDSEQKAAAQRVLETLA